GCWAERRGEVVFTSRWEPRRCARRPSGGRNAVALTGTRWDEAGRSGPRNSNLLDEIPAKVASRQSFFSPRKSGSGPAVSDPHRRLEPHEPWRKLNKLFD